MSEASLPDPNPDLPRGPAVLRWTEACEVVAGVVLLLTIFVLVLIQAAQRYLPIDSWVWTGELAKFSLVWLTFAVAGYLLGRDQHITLQLVDRVPRPRVLRAIRMFAAAVVAATCAAFAYEAALLVSAETTQSSPALGMPMSWLYVIPLCGLALTGIRAVVQVGAETAALLRRRPVSAGQGGVEG